MTTRRTNFLPVLERASGNLSSWYAVLRVLGVEVVPHPASGSGKTLGQQIATLRRRRGLGYRELARIVAVSPSTQLIGMSM